MTTLAELMGGSLGYGHDGDCSVFDLRLPRTPNSAAQGASGRDPRPLFHTTSTAGDNGD